MLTTTLQYQTNSNCSPLLPVLINKHYTKCPKQNLWKQYFICPAQLYMLTTNWFVADRKEMPSSAILHCTSISLPVNYLAGLVVKASTSRAEDPGFKSCLRQDFSRVESYQWFKNWHSGGCPARHLALQGQHWDWLARCQYTVTGWDGKFGLQLPSQSGST